MDPPGAYHPRGHAAQPWLFPVSFEKRPAAHGTQSEAPPLLGWSSQVPAGQAEQWVLPSAAYQPSAHAAQGAPSPVALEKVPAAHGTQSLAESLPPTLRYVPGRQLVHDEEPAGAKEPRVQAWQALAFVRAQVPLGQGSHSHRPGTGVKVPFPQTSQGVTLARALEALPGGHSAQSVSKALLCLPCPASEALAAGEYLPCPASEALEHAAQPVAGLYLPCPHWTHAPPSGPHHPALQVQLVRSADMGGEALPSTHCA